MERLFDDFETVEADGTTAMLATREDGDNVLMSRDWAHVTSSDGKIEAEWEPLIDSLISIDLEDFDFSEQITIPLVTAIDRIRTSGLIDTDDYDDGDRARATLEYLVDRDVIRVKDSKVVLLEDSIFMDIDHSDLDYTDLLVRVLVFRNIRRQTEELIKDIESSALDFETRGQELEDFPLPDLLSIDRSENISSIVDYLSDFEIILEKYESDLRMAAKRMHPKWKISDLDELQERVSNAIDAVEREKVRESDELANEEKLERSSVDWRN